MESTYTKLIEELRSSAKLEQDCFSEDCIGESGHAKMLYAAADAIETMSRNINSYADAAFQRANECNAMQRRIADLLKEKVEAAEVCVAEKQPATDILYLCDRRACDDCNHVCTHTADIRHAKNFELDGNAMFEQEEKR